MASRTYERLSIEAFGTQLLFSEDLDPLYVALQGMVQGGTDWSMDEDQLKRWLLAYVCFYHAGFACWASEHKGGAFWTQLLTAAANETEAPVGGRWPRGSERRHFRGKNADAALNHLMERYVFRPEGFFEHVSDAVRLREGPQETLTFAKVSERTRSHVGFGPWIGFKVADLVDRVLGIPVAFDNAAVFMFDDPKRAAIRLWEEREGPKWPANAQPKEAVVLEQVSEHLIRYFSGYKAPPFYDRPINIQEVETILCKWKSHMNGHYPLFNDTVEISKGLLPWAKVSITARRLLGQMPRVSE
ncbi:alpha-glutamyl/putrescinyl thymine pyrophosphorylase [Stenotrophomonas phage Sonora]|nr:alpha-glutamyl/putrescinyl thymine pyrophosphorylase [Stenotrophomonas phage Sonora]